MELQWLDNVELFEMLDANGMENIGFREFCTVIFLVSAFERNQLLQCLYQHGALFFDVIGGGQSSITGERVKCLAKLLGISNKSVDTASEELFEHLNQSTLVSFEDFQLLYYQLFDQIQQGQNMAFPALSNGTSNDYQMNDIDGQFFNATAKILEGTQSYFGSNIDLFNPSLTGEILDDDLKLNSNKINAIDQLRKRKRNINQRNSLSSLSNL